MVEICSVFKSQWLASLILSHTCTVKSAPQAKFTALSFLGFPLTLLQPWVPQGWLSPDSSGQKLGVPSGDLAARCHRWTIAICRVISGGERWRSLFLVVHWASTHHGKLLQVVVFVCVFFFKVYHYYYQRMSLLYTHTRVHFLLSCDILYGCQVKTSVFI